MSVGTHFLTEYGLWLVTLSVTSACRGLIASCTTRLGILTFNEDVDLIITFSEEFKIINSLNHPLN